MKKWSIIVCLLLIAAACAAMGWYWPLLPPHVPVHWNAAGDIDGYGPRAALLLLGPGLMLLMLLLGLLLPRISPRRFEISSFEATYSYLCVVTVALMGYVYALVLLDVVHGGVAMHRAVPAGVFILLILIGNPMGKVRRNFFMGIRTPWTLASEAVWYTTHRLAAKLMVASGLLGLVALWLGAPHWMLLSIALAWAPMAAGYSLLLYKRLPH
ncbi:MULTISPECIES: SdpI family protein [unclassified Duganella]|jgi:uncharacterized membrane protein|uniref:SdpI family protein n=1 Tax=unclassified Duganella TaxID=2636909 RepID=UPI00088D88B3|nr:MULTISPECIES: SdpI family protein [unclassified Duganella]SDF45061.1 Uncharacterized membrane protein [Duganella sp. OV458]SDI81622.1 Uncharacterized membrane protein [Duganella sp. OV510]